MGDVAEAIGLGRRGAGLAIIVVAVILALLLISGLALLLISPD